MDPAPRTRLFAGVKAEPVAIVYPAFIRSAEPKQDNGQSARCSASGYRRRTPLRYCRYLDANGRSYRQTEVCETHARELCTGMRVIDWKAVKNATNKSVCRHGDDHSPEDTVADRLPPLAGHARLKNDPVILARRCDSPGPAQNSHKKRELAAAQLHRSALLRREFIGHRGKDRLAKEHLSSLRQRKQGVMPH
jgi:hypothetical protein